MAKINQKIVFIVGEDTCQYTCSQDPCKAEAKDECKQTLETCKDTKSYLTDQGEFVLRHPSNREWNEYQAAKLEAHNTASETKVSMNDAMCDLFDKLVIKLENLIDNDNTPITMDNFKDRIYDKEKSGMIMRGVELNNQDIDLKNS